MSIKILIADDHPLIAEGIKNTFENQPNFEVVKMVVNGVEVLDFLSKNKVDVVLLDVNMPKMDGIECAKQILQNYPSTKIAVLSMHQEKSVIQNLMQIGVNGYMLKTIPSDELLVAIQSIYNGKTYFNADVTKALLSDDVSSTLNPLPKQSPLVDQLTTREIEIIKLIAQGNTNTQIGEQLYISPRTVDTHRTNLMKKLDINNMASLIRFAFQNGLTN